MDGRDVCEFVYERERERDQTSTQSEFMTNGYGQIHLYMLREHKVKDTLNRGNVGTRE